LKLLIAFFNMAERDIPSLSILIPAFRWDISTLTEELKNQAGKLTVPFEIIILDDASGDPWTKVYRNLADGKHVFCHTMSVNIGRAAARNRLASLARYEALLFMDCDAQLTDSRYVSKMLEHFDGNSVITGMTVYLPEKPSDTTRVLRWKYGRKRESVPAEKRSGNPWQSFTTFHFLVPASLFPGILFQSLHPGYGHEDTFFGIALQQAGIPVIHTDIPLMHDGLDDADLFLEKTADAVGTLATILMQEGCQSATVKSIRLARVYCRFRLLLHKRLISTLLTGILPVLKKNLSGSIPSLFLMDVYKLGLLVNFITGYPPE